MALRQSVPYPLQNVYAQKIGLLALIVILCITQIRFTVKDARRTYPADLGGVTQVPTKPVYIEFMNAGMWEYLRKGLNYVEASGEEYPTDFVHPGGVAYGPLALTPIAIEDVIQRCGALTGHTVEDVLSDPKLYEAAALYYADLLLRHYLKLEYWTMSPESVFGILQRAWFLGPGLYQKGQPIPSSRKRNAEDYIEKMRHMTRQAQPLASPIAGPLIMDIQKYPDQVSVIPLDE